MNVWLLTFIVIGYAAIATKGDTTASLSDACMNNITCYLLKANISEIVFENETISYELHTNNDTVLRQNIILRAPNSAVSISTFDTDGKAASINAGGFNITLINLNFTGPLEIKNALSVNIIRSHFFGKTDAPYPSLAITEVETVMISHSKFIDNHFGVLVAHSINELSISDCSFERNNSSSLDISIKFFVGVVLHISEANQSAVVSRSTFQHNSGAAPLGCLAVSDAPLIFTNCTFEDNECPLASSLFHSPELSMQNIVCEPAGCLDNANGLHSWSLPNNTGVCSSNCSLNSDAVHVNASCSTCDIPKLPPTTLCQSSPCTITGNVENTDSIIIAATVTITGNFTNKGNVIFNLTNNTLIVRGCVSLEEGSSFDIDVANVDHADNNEITVIQSPCISGDITSVFGTKECFITERQTSKNKLSILFSLKDECNNQSKNQSSNNTLGIVFGIIAGIIILIALLFVIAVFSKESWRETIMPFNRKTRTRNQKALSK